MAELGVPQYKLIKNMTGQVFDRLTVLYKGRSTGNHLYWVCQCTCGAICEVRGDRLRRNEARSCRCHDTERKTKYYAGEYGSPTYISWLAMIQRCTNPNDSSWHRYGKRGITICQEWSDFGTFYSDMGERPPEHTIDRIDNDKGYCPENCRWANAFVQNRNRSDNRMITINGVTKILSDWCREYGIPSTTVSSRIALGMDPVLAITTPRKYKRNGKRSRKIKRASAGEEVAGTDEVY